MSRQRKGRTRSDAFWDALIGRVVHPTQLAIIEAMLWIGRPMSASELVAVFDDEEELGFSSVSYHVRRLADDLGALKVVRRRPVRGAIETFYRLAIARRQSI